MRPTVHAHHAAPNNSKRTKKEACAILRSDAIEKSESLINVECLAFVLYLSQVLKPRCQHYSSCKSKVHHLQLSEYQEHAQPVHAYAAKFKDNFGSTAVLFPSLMSNNRNRLNKSYKKCKSKKPLQIGAKDFNLRKVR